MQLKTIVLVVFFIIFISIQYSLNRILFELREIKKIFISKRDRD